MNGCRTFCNGDGIVYSLKQSARQGYLCETTNFVTFNINYICTRFSHEDVIKALEHFLGVYATEHDTVAEGMTNEAIIALVRLVLLNQFFIYENKLYRQVHGGASGSLLTIPLVCIYLFYDQSSSLVHTLINDKNEVFGR